jgi:hypothetical protein
VGTAVATAAAPVPPGRPGYWLTFRGAAFAQITAGIFLWAIGAVASLAGLIGLQVQGSSLYEPWVIDGPWGLLAALGWGLLVVALVGWSVRERLEARTGQRLSRVLTFASVAIGGYAPWLVTTTVSGRVALSLLLMPAVARALIFEHSGAARRLPFAEPRALAVAFALLVAGFVLVLPYSALHPLVADGSGQSGPSADTSGTSGYVYDVHPGEIVEASAGLQTGLFPITVSAVKVLANASLVHVVKVTLGSNMPFDRPRPASDFHVRIGARQSLWVGYAISLRRCASFPVGVTRIRVSYRELGIALEQTVALGANNTLLSCDAT